MIRSTEVKFGKEKGATFGLLIVLLAGCSQSPVPNTPVEKPVPAAGSQSSNQFETVQASFVTNLIARLKQEQLDSLTQLKAQVQELEKQLAARATSTSASQKEFEENQKVSQERERRLVARIVELENKVGELQAGKVLPEITVAGDEAPTTSELDQKIKVVERNVELAREAATVTAQESPKISAGLDGFGLSSGDGNFRLRLKGLVQLDARNFLADNAHSLGNDSFLLRRARPILEGELYKKLSFQFVPDFGGSAVQVVDAWANYELSPGLQLKFGKFKGPVGFENLLSDAATAFNERSLVSDLVPTRSIGVQVWGELNEGVVGYTAGLFNAGSDSRNPATSDFGDSKEIAAKLAFQPFKKRGPALLSDIVVGAAGSYSQVSSNSLALPATGGGTLPGYTSLGAQQFFAYNPLIGTVVGEGDKWRISPYISYLYGPFGFLGEFGLSHEGVLNNATLRAGELQHNAWQIAGQWVLTGESASFGALQPSHPFALRTGGWGALQAVARIGSLEIDRAAFPTFSDPNTSAHSAMAWSVGLNWYLNRNLKIMSSFNRTTFQGGGASFDPSNPATQVAPSLVTRQDENAVLTRIQLSF